MAFGSIPFSPKYAFGGALCAVLIASSGWQIAGSGGASAPTLLAAVPPPAPAQVQAPATSAPVGAAPAATSNAGQNPGVRADAPRPAAAFVPPARPLVLAPEVVEAAVSAAAAVDPNAPFEYVVQRGDTLFSLAQRYNTRLGQIVALNPGLVPDRIKAGQRLTIRPNATEDIPLPAELEPEPVAAAATVRPPLLPRPNHASDADGGLWIRPPYRTQFDGDEFEESNCGPAALGSAMAYFGEWWSTQGVRSSVNRVTGDWSTDGGSSWLSLQVAAEERGFRVHGPYHPSGGYRYWDLDDLLTHTELGRPLILLTRYRALPGHESAGWNGDHYIVFLGVTDAGVVVYHDPAFRGTDEGAFRTMDQATLDRAWSHTSTGENRTAMSLYWPG